MNELFAILKRRLAKEPGAKFDQQFWARFDSEFSAPPKNVFVFRFAYASVFMLLVVSSIAIYKMNSAKKASDLQFAQLLEHKDLYTNIEMLKEFESLPTSDEEWEVLLQGTDG